MCVCVCVCVWEGGGAGSLSREWRQALNMFEENIVLLGERRPSKPGLCFEPCSRTGQTSGVQNNDTGQCVWTTPGVKLQSGLGSCCVTFTRSAELTRPESALLFLRLPKQPVWLHLVETCSQHSELLSLTWRN